MKRFLIILLSALTLASLLPSSAVAGVAFSDIPAHGAPVYVRLSDGTFAPLQLDASGLLQVAAPTGSATATLQSAGNTKLDTINTTLTGGIPPATGTPTANWGGNFGTSSAGLLNAGAYRYVWVQNVSASNNVACRWGGTAIINDSASWMLKPGEHREYAGSFVPNAALNCIASASSTPIYAETK